MNTILQPETANWHNPHAQPSLVRTIQGVSRGVYTLFRTPEHDHALFNEVNDVLATPQQTQPPIEEEIKLILNGPATLIDKQKLAKADGRSLLGLMGVCLQFTSHVPELRPFARTPFRHIESLYEGIASKGSDRPLDFSGQLTIALEQTDGDLAEAAWRLFMTSRQHARWLDEPAIADMPNFTRDQKKERMLQFSAAVAACKSHETTPNQDASGDTYYAWTHTLGRVAFGALAKNDGCFGVRMGGAAMRNGTQFMNKVAFKITPQNMPSNHVAASTYGNAIGDTLVSYVR